MTKQTLVCRIVACIGKKPTVIMQDIVVCVVGSTRQWWAVRMQAASSQDLRKQRLPSQERRARRPVSPWPITWSTDATVSSLISRRAWKRNMNYGNSSKVGSHYTAWLQDFIALCCIT